MAVDILLLFGAKDYGRAFIKVVSMNATQLKRTARPRFFGSGGTPKENLPPEGVGHPLGYDLNDASV
jgi:hypothetical protein